MTQFARRSIQQSFLWSTSAVNTFPVSELAMLLPYDFVGHSRSYRFNRVRSSQDQFNSFEAILAFCRYRASMAGEESIPLITLAVASGLPSGNNSPRL